jgi:catalase (peroxidase I)
MDNEQKCPFSSKAHSGRSNSDWWPNQLNLKVLHQNPPARDPMGARTLHYHRGQRFFVIDFAGLHTRANLLSHCEPAMRCLVAPGLKPEAEF